MKISNPQGLVKSGIIARRVLDDPSFEKETDLKAQAMAYGINVAMPRNRSGKSEAARIIAGSLWDATAEYALKIVTVDSGKGGGHVMWRGAATLDDARGMLYRLQHRVATHDLALVRENGDIVARGTRPEAESSAESILGPEISAMQSLRAAIESAKLQHGHRGAEDRLTLYHLMDAHSDKSLCMVRGWESVEAWADRLIRLEGTSSAVNILRDGSCIATASQQRDGTVRIDRWTTAPTPSEIAAVNVLRNPMGVHYIAIDPATPDAKPIIMRRHSDDSGLTWDAPEPRDRQRELWMKHAQQYNDDLWRSHDWDNDICRACDITAQLMIDARIMCKPINRKPGEQLARAFSFGHADDYADRISPARRAGLD